MTPAVSVQQRGNQYNQYNLNYSSEHIKIYIFVSMISRPKIYSDSTPLHMYII